MIYHILIRSSVWVWPLLLLLLVLGAMQMKSRSLPAAMVTLVPVAMIALSLHGVVSSFGATSHAVGAWLLGVMIVLGANQCVLHSPRHGRYMPDSRRFLVPGSFLPLVLMLAIFCTRFVVGVAKAMNPPAAASLLFVIAISVCLGIFSGALLARAIWTLNTARMPA